MQFGSDVGANDIFYTYSRRLDLAGLSRSPCQRVLVVLRAVALGGDLSLKHSA